ncbi:aldo/keto reductase [Nitratireductor pacificus]|nr:aldo/keto reductase [Nitratireductor pacificus]
MEKRRLGRSELMVSQICLGTMTFGEQNSEQEAHAQMDLAAERGVNFLDMAELYPIPPKPETQGRTELYVGSWIKARGNRADTIIASKVVGRTDNDWFRGGRSSRLVRADIVDAIDKSLARLQTDYIDLYQIHWPDREIPFGSNPMRVTALSEPVADETPIAETLAVFAELVKAGKIRHFGLSNESSWGTMRYVLEAERGVGPRPIALQNSYSLVNRTYEVNLAETCQREGIGLLAYSPLAQGYLSGKYDNGALPEGSRKALFDRLQRYEKPGAAEAFAAYNAMAREFGLTPARFAHAFVNARPFIAANIIGATTMAQLEEALSSIDVGWTAEMQEAVDGLHQRIGNPCF